MRRTALLCVLLTACGERVPRLTITINGPFRVVCRDAAAAETEYVSDAAEARLISSEPESVCTVDYGSVVAWSLDR